MPRKIGLQRRAQRAGDGRTVKIERHVARSHAGKFPRGAGIDFVANGKEPDRDVPGSRAEIDWLDPYFVQMPAAEPPTPRFAALDRLLQETLRHAGIETRNACAQRN